MPVGPYIRSFTPGKPGGDLWAGFLLVFGAPQDEIFIDFEIFVPQAAHDFFAMAVTFGWFSDALGVSLNTGAPDPRFYTSALGVHGVGGGSVGANWRQEGPSGGGGSTTQSFTSLVAETWLPVSWHIGRTTAVSDPMVLSGASPTDPPDLSNNPITYLVFGDINTVSDTSADFGDPLPNDGATEFLYRNIKVGTILGGTDLHDGVTDPTLDGFTVAVVDGSGDPDVTSGALVEFIGATNFTVSRRF